MSRFVRFPQNWGQSDAGDSRGERQSNALTVAHDDEWRRAKNADHNDERTTKGENAGPQQRAKPAGENQSKR